LKTLDVLGAALTILLSAGACAVAPPGPSPSEPSSFVAPGRHEDGSGPLGVLGAPLFDGAAVDPREGGGRWTFGVPLCVLDPAVSATLQSVEATQSVGSYELLGIKVRTFIRFPDNTGIITVDGFPPRVPNPLGDVAGHVVPNGCRAGDNAPYTELLIGLGLMGPEGGGFEGVDVTYSANGATWTLHADIELLICGPAVGERC